MKKLEFPFEENYIISNVREIKEKLFGEENDFIEKRIAILGGFTTNEIKNVLEIFLLNYGIKPSFYESEYNKYFEDAVFDNVELKNFNPEIIYICTSNRNIQEYPSIKASESEINEKIDVLYEKYKTIWDNIKKRYGSIIIQNNFDYPTFRVLGNKDASDIHGRVNFVTRINNKFYEYARSNDKFYICDINYISSSIGLSKWNSNSMWYLYKYPISFDAVPHLSYNVANIIKSLCGLNKKALSIDLDNTLWGGVIGDDGVEKIEIGKETAVGEAYSAFQNYIKLQKDIGVALTLNSKNDEKVALDGLKHIDSILQEEDFISKRINYKPKSDNLLDIAHELNLLPESFVFVDDNPAERKIVEDNIKGVAVPIFDQIENAIEVIDKSAYFEVTTLSNEDIDRNKMYADNIKRNKERDSYTKYDDYLASLQMKAEITPFLPLYFSRIAQLCNKSNQFNLTTKRYSEDEIYKVANDKDKITLSGRLKDKFGDNGIVSLIIGSKEKENNKILNIDLFLMSCRVLKRNMEFVMMDELISYSAEQGIEKIVGYYYPTEKNKMVKELYKDMGFILIDEDKSGNTKWEYIISNAKKYKERFIEVVKG